MQLPRQSTGGELTTPSGFRLPPLRRRGMAIPLGFGGQFGLYE